MYIDLANNDKKLYTRDQVVAKFVELPGDLIALGFTDGLISIYYTGTKQTVMLMHQGQDQNQDQDQDTGHRERCADLRKTISTWNCIEHTSNG